MATQPSFDDVSLLARIAQQDQAALSALYDRYAKIIYAVAFKSLASVEESEEVVLDVFSQVWRISGHYDPAKARVDTWLFMIARSRIVDRLRRIQRATKVTISSEHIIDRQSGKSDSDPIEDVFISERRTQVLSALKLIPDEQRQVIELAYYKGFSQSEIAAQTGLSLGTVKTRIRLGLTKLRAALDAWE
ncbi:MAG: sigma-70 family RNA polymerase sigma factor [Cyanobacteria bacterium CRU_2_1]|nr:sigma-70 family RNA polymerase sigma factor [Cyanobacteria bacterium RU_5_0]NJR57621.1 sigma-70 family RNA polymerase sigma factor [Cyanobacteria bacterium CRU_2_1]